MVNQLDTDELLADEEHAIDAQTLHLLQRDAARYTTGGQWFFVVAVLAGVALLAVTYHLTAVYVADLNHATNGSEMLILLLVRSVTFGGLSIAILFALFTVGNACVDQATRFRKRLYSAHMLNYAFKTFSDEIVKGGKVDVNDLVKLFEAWNANVDSAFSRVKFQKKSKNLVVNVKDGIFAMDDDPTPKKGRKGRDKG